MVRCLVSYVLIPCPLVSFQRLLCSSLCVFPSCACVSPPVCQHYFLCDSPSWFLPAAPPHLCLVLLLVSVYVVFVFPLVFSSLFCVLCVMFPVSQWNVFLDFDFAFLIWTSLFCLFSSFCLGCFLSPSVCFYFFFVSFSFENKACFLFLLVLPPVWSAFRSTLNCLSLVLQKRM